MENCCEEYGSVADNGERVGIVHLAWLAQLCVDCGRWWQIVSTVQSTNVLTIQRNNVIDYECLTTQTIKSVPF